MSRYEYAQRALRDLAEIHNFGHRKWSLAQADHYAKALGDSCGRLADYPDLGRACEELGPDIRRLEVLRHVIFYRKLGLNEHSSVLILRFLHARAVPAGWHFSMFQRPSDLR